LLHQAMTMLRFGAPLQQLELRIGGSPRTFYAIAVLPAPDRAEHGGVMLLAWRPLDASEGIVLDLIPGDHSATTGAATTVRWFHADSELRARADSAPTDTRIRWGSRITGPLHVSGFDPVPQLPRFTVSLHLLGSATMTRASPHGPESLSLVIPPTSGAGMAMSLPTRGRY
jgi:hypothetical protein